VGGYIFTSIPAPKSFLELDAFLIQLSKFFEGRRYPVQAPLPVIRNDERTLFASTAGQVYDDFIYGNAVQNNPRQCVLSQPVIRLQSIDIIGSTEGFSTSFIHAATEKWNANIEDHLKTLDDWLDFFSYLGLHVGSLCLKIKQEDNDWMGRTVTSEMIKINYGGLEVGIANFFLNIPQNNDGMATLSDIGIGAERLVWSINKSPSYFDSIGPISYVIILSRVLLDAIRTATLMVSSGLTPGHKDHGSKLRLMTGIIADQIQHVNLYELVRHYYDQWAKLIKLSLSYEQTYLTIWREANKVLNLKTNYVIGAGEPFDQNHEDFLRRAIQKRTITIEGIRNMRKKKYIKSNIKNIFLAGGGSEKDSVLFDRRFVEALDLTKPLVYIPNAMKSKPYQSCLEWLQSVMNPLGVKNIEMWENLQSRAETSSIAGIYIGGGDTVKLLKELRESEFVKYLIEAIASNVPIYGGSAGAIILGEDIRTSVEARNLDRSESEGLKIISGYSVICHYDAKDEKTAKELSKLLGCKIIAIPEKAGGYFSSGSFTNYGTEPISIIQSDRVICLEPNHSTSLF
jgi:dipeptidase E